jgi:hypothetical protein
MTGTTTPESDVAIEVLRVLREATERAVPLRVIGGVAVRLHTSSHTLPALRREPNDIDLVTLQGKSKAVTKLMEDLGYSSDPEFNYTNGHRRLLYFDVGNQRQVDVFVGSFEMCHVIPITTRIELEEFSIPLAELLLTKLQVVQLNEKDQRDIIAILAHHPVGQKDDETVNAAYIAALLARDWGLWRTTRMNLERAREALPNYELPDDARQAIVERLDQLWSRIQAEPKSPRWRMRNRIGDRLRWYEDVEEVN